MLYITMTFYVLEETNSPSDEFGIAVREIAELNMRTAVVVVGFDGDFPILCQTNSKGEVSIREGAAIVGEGEYLASAALLQREQNSGASLSATLYNVFEAKKYAERVPSVGEITSMSVMKRDGMYRITDEGLDFLLKRYKEFGPKYVRRDALVSVRTFLEKIE